MTTAFLWDESFAWHDAGTYPYPEVEPASVPETGDSKRRIRNLVEKSGLLSQLVQPDFAPASDGQIVRAHSADYLALLKSIDETGGAVGRFAHIGKGGLNIVRLAAGAAIAAVDGVVDGAFDNAYALVRPCGHHAERNGGMGFCIINNVAIAALHALDVRKLDRIAIVDWDVHHGNGTQQIFWKDPRVLAISLHQEFLFAGGGGLPDEVGADEGRGTTINISLPPGSGDGAYRTAFERVVLPALDRFRPSLIIVASGLDAGAHDLLGRMILHSDSFRMMTEHVMAAADRLCGGKLVFCHEGGYNPVVTPFLGLATIETLARIRTDIIDPFAQNVRKQPGQMLQQHQDDAITLSAIAAGL